MAKSVADSNQLERKHSEKKFDDGCFIELSDIFNKNSKWKTIATVLGYEEYVAGWQKLRNPTKVVLMYAEVLRMI